MAGGGDNERVKLPARQRRGRERRGPRTRQAARSAWTGARRGFGGRVERFSTLYFFFLFFLFFFSPLLKQTTNGCEGRKVFLLLLSPDASLCSV